MTIQLNNDFSNTFRKTRMAIALATLAGIASVATVHAAPYPTGTVLGLDQGVGSGANTACSSGSCFSMEIAPGFVAWTDFGSGTDGGMIIGVDGQASGGQELAPSPSNETTGAMTTAWSFFSNWGTFYLPAGHVQNIFDNADCVGAACVGKTALNTFKVAWNGNIVPMGSAAGCNSTNSCTADQNNGIHISGNGYTINGNTYELDRYTNVVPDGDASGFGNVKFSALLRGTVYTPNPLTQTGANSIGDGTTVGVVGTNRVTSAQLVAAGIAVDDSVGGVESTTGMYYDFDIDISGAPGANAVVVIPLSFPLPASAIYRKYDSLTSAWVTFTEDGANNILKSAPGAIGSDCTGVTWVAGLIEGSYCVQVTIQDNGVNDDDAVAGTIKDPAGFGTGVVPSPVVIVDTRTSGSSGCSISNTPAKASHHLDWALLLGFLSWMGVRRSKWFSRDNN